MLSISSCHFHGIRKNAIRGESHSDHKILSYALVTASKKLPAQHAPEAPIATDDSPNVMDALLPSPSERKGLVRAREEVSLAKRQCCNSKSACSTLIHILAFASSSDQWIKKTPICGKCLYSQRQMPCWRPAKACEPLIHSFLHQTQAKGQADLRLHCKLKVGSLQS